MSDGQLYGKLLETTAQASWYELESCRYAHKYQREALIDNFMNSGVRPLPEHLDPEVYPYHGKRMTVSSTRDDYEIPVIFYESEGCTEQTPVVFYIHGGNFCYLYPECYDYNCVRFRDDLGFRVVNIGYRLAPEHPLPTGIEDCYDVIAHFHAHTAEYGIDPQKMIVAGDSSGGNFAVVMSYLAALRGEFRFCAQYLAFPYTDPSIYPLELQNTAGKGAVAPMELISGKACYCSYDELNDPRVSPVNIHAPYLRKMPPTLLVTCELDNLRDQGERMGHLIAENGVPVLHKRFQNASHGFLNPMSISAAPRETIDAVWDSFLIPGLKMLVSMETKN